MKNFKQELQSNNTDLQNILNTINNLPNAGGEGVELPELTNEGATADILSGKQLINQEGEIVEGTMPNNGKIVEAFNGIDSKSYIIPSGYTSGGIISLDNTIDNEVDEQTDLIAQIATVVEGLPEASGSGGGEYALQTCTVEIGADESHSIGLVVLDPNTGLIQTATLIDTSGTHTYTNVLCDSVATIVYSLSPMYNTVNAAHIGQGIDTTDGWSKHHFKINATPGGTASIYIEENI